MFAPAPDTQDDLMQKYGLTAEQAAGGSPDLAWLRADDSIEKHLFSVGDRLPIGIEVFPEREHNDVVLWIEDRGAVLAGDTIADFGRGFEIPPEWLRQGVTREGIAAGLRPRLERPVEIVLTAHSGPADRAALECDVLVPGARPDSITVAVAHGLRCAVVAPAANVPYGAGALDVLHRNGVVAIPDFVSNGGGNLLYELDQDAQPADSLIAIETVVRDRVARVLTEADDLRITPYAGALRPARAYVARATNAKP